MTPRAILEAVLFVAEAPVPVAELSEVLELPLTTVTAELEALSDRWRVVPLLLEGLPYREIHDITAVSVTTIGRVARCLGQGAGGYRRVAEELGYDLTHAVH